MLAPAAALPAVPVVARGPPKKRGGAERRAFFFPPPKDMKPATKKRRCVDRVMTDLWLDKLYAKYFTKNFCGP
jgi:hypothetical protein